jgi:predicted dehydrogenase
MLRCAIVGCGQIAQAHAAALRFLAEDGHARVVALADPDIDALARVEQITGPVAVRSTSGREVIDHPDVDAVVVVAPTRFHQELVDAVIAAGKPMFIEKPLAPRYDAVVGIVDAVNAAGLATQVGFQSRFHPIIRFVRDAVADDRFGRAMGYTIRDDQFWPTGAVIDGHSSWRSQSAEAGGGALLEHSIHSCDIACWLFGPARRVHAYARNMFGYDVEDVAAVTVEHESGVIGTLLTVFNGVRDREERRLEVFFERGLIEATTDFLVDAPEDSLLTQGETGPATRIDCRELLRTTFAADGVDPDRRFFVYQYLAHRAFAAAVAAGHRPAPTVDDALHAHRIVEAAYRSARTSTVVNVANL